MIILKCENCGMEFQRIRKDPRCINFFCSKSCAATYNGKKYPKRILTRKCSREGCHNPVKSCRHTLCSAHYEEYIENKRLFFINKTIGEYRQRDSVKGKHPSWVNSHIRLMCKTMNGELLKKPCAICGYDKHVELCHIKPISKFDDNDTLFDVNNIKNVIQLCRNCHWEFDHGLTQLPT